VNQFDPDGVLLSSTTYPNINMTDFGYYISGDGGVGYSQDSRQPGSNEARVLAFAGTGGNAGSWWLCFEDKDLLDPDDDNDYNDAILFVESINPTPVAHTSWGAVKSRFR
jgi:hypothetical protein